jgi:hypothetical protein
MDSKTELYNLINDIKIQIYDDKHTIMTIKHKKRTELQVKYYENKLKMNKLLLLMAEKEYNRTLTDKLRDMIQNKIKETVVERMELTDEMAEKGILDDGEYLQHSNDCKDMYEKNELF